MNKLLLSCKHSNVDKISEMAKNISEHFCKDIVILNIGTNKHIHDALGPLVGTILHNKGFKFPVYGTLKNPVDNRNLDDVLSKIFLRHGENLFILAIDATYVDGLDGTIVLRDTPVKPGTALRKDFTSAGDMSIVGVVKSSYEKNPVVKDFDLVADLASSIADMLLKAQDNYFDLLEQYSA